MGPKQNYLIFKFEKLMGQPVIGGFRYIKIQNFAVLNSPMEKF
jgi:hypothetical protein